MATTPVTSITLQNLQLTHAGYVNSGTFNINFGALADVAGTVAFYYSWKPKTSTEWLEAVTTAPATGSVTTTAASFSGIFDLGESDAFTGLTHLDIDFKVEARYEAQAATGSLRFQAGSNYADGIAFTVLGTTYELTSDGTFAAGNVPVLFDVDMTPTELAESVADAISAANSSVAVSSQATDTLNLVAVDAGTAGNAAITVPASITATGMSNGHNVAVAHAITSYNDADTNAIGEAVTPMKTSVDYGSRKVVESFTLNQFGQRAADHIGQGWARKSIAYKMIDMLRKGELEKFDLMSDSYGRDQRRGVLISVDEWNRVRGTNSFNIELKAKQWFAWYANKGLSRPSFFEDGKKIYALFESKIINGRTYQTIVAYLLSGESYAELASADIT